ncbi:NADH dehydrogenase protein [Halorhabdus tiamatea SARL4B]|uniref:NADH dehydrogenase n=1 Tax=Halorhabdus tiamatea SARL4B TaxID=1033806 RepID=F7PG79_9EURY|nr:FAD-dependent oxidoreductase [Halorhabdus tiamatea]ERJ06321.1 NADH dehydrogenase protein [Halorhabdus tiamatea SARL4B]CCQ34626.1 NADH dehydrogenase [Halorhabdus tiamatea SARL4B]
MTESVVVLGSGYAGVGAIQRLESALGDRADLTWVSDRPYHLVLHEVHRCIREPTVEEHVTIPIEELKSPSTTFVEGHVETIDVDDRSVELADSEPIEYDYLLVAIGSRTAFFRIDGLEAHALTLKGLDDALAIHDAVESAAETASTADPARVVVGGAGQTGVQVAGEVAAYREETSSPIEVVLVEGLESVLPGENRSFQSVIRERLEERSIDLRTGNFVSKVDDERVYFDDGDDLAYDVLVWTGGITGQSAMADVRVGKDHRSNRLKTATTFQTDDERVFALGDAALVDQPGEEPAPPNAQAAWQAADVAAENIARSIRGQPLSEWRYENKGTVVSVGDEAVATDVMYSPVETFNGMAAELLKKVIATRWIADVSSISRAVSAWSEM